MVDSDDEREAVALVKAKGHRLESQLTKKGLKNGARLPRTAGLRTITELSKGLTAAGIDPSRIEARAAILAKAAGAKRKRLREEEEAEMDVDEGKGGDGEDGEGEWMDVDDDTTPRKRAKANSGVAVVADGKRHPRSDRRFAGMRDTAVRTAHLTFRLRFSSPTFSPLRLTPSDSHNLLSFSHSKQRRRRGCATLGSASATCTHGLARATVRSKSKW